ncbi:MAG: hypothetical protein PHR36_04740 [Patescibacteria group bacterium]|nr:hypothetical protein [Patescibacteria group bacterium]
MKNDKSKFKIPKPQPPKIGSVQAIEDFYLNLGYRGDNLRKALLKDKEYQGLLRGKKATLTTQTKVSLADKKKYVLATDADFEIVDKCRRLEILKPADDDRLLINLIKSQLEVEWRPPLIEALNKLLRKYQK